MCVWRAFLARVHFGDERAGRPFLSLTNHASGQKLKSLITELCGERDMPDIEMGDEKPVRTKSSIKRALEKDLRPGLRTFYEKQLDYVEAREKSRNRKAGRRGSSTTTFTPVGPPPLPGYENITLRVMRAPGAPFGMELEVGDEEDDDGNATHGLPMVKEIEPGGVVANAGTLRIGDIVVAINGVDVTEDDEMLTNQLTKSAGAIDFTVQRQQKAGAKSQAMKASALKSFAMSAPSASGGASAGQQRRAPQQSKARGSAPSSNGGWSLNKKFSVNGIEIEGVVESMPMSIQRGFRIKTQAILLLQLIFQFLVAVVVNLTSTVIENPNGMVNITLPGTDGSYFASEAKLYDVGGLLLILTPGTWNPILFGFFCLMLLPFLACIRERHPWNLIFAFFWSILWGVFMGTTQVPGGFIRSQILFIMFGNVTFGVAILLVFSSCLTHTIQGERKLISFLKAGFFAWLTMILCSIAFFWLKPSWYESGYIYSGSVMMASIIFMFFAVDLGKLCKRMTPDEYMKGVIYLVRCIPL